MVRDLGSKNKDVCTVSPCCRCRGFGIYIKKRQNYEREREKKKDDIQIEESGIFFDLLSVDLLTSGLIGLRSALCVFPRGYA